MNSARYILKEHMFIGNRESVARESVTGSQEPGNGNRETGTGNKEPGTRNREPGIRNREARTNLTLIKYICFLKQILQC